MVDGNRANNTAESYIVWNASNGTLEKVWLINAAKDALQVQEPAGTTHENKFQNPTVKTPVDVGVHCNPSDLHFSELVVANPGSSGMLLTAGGNIIEGPHIYGATDTAMWIQSSYNHINARLFDNDACGIVVSTGYEGNVISGVFHTNGVAPGGAHDSLDGNNNQVSGVFHGIGTGDWAVQVIGSEIVIHAQIYGSYAFHPLAIGGARNVMNGYGINACDPQATSGDWAGFSDFTSNLGAT